MPLWPRGHTHTPTHTVTDESDYKKPGAHRPVCIKHA